MTDETPTPNPDEGKETPLNQEDAKALRESIGGLNQGLKDLMTFAQQRQEQEQQQRRPPAAEEPEEPAPPELDEDALEQMPRRQFLQYFEERMSTLLGKQIGTELKPLREAIAAVGTDSTRTRLTAEATAFADKHEDFADFSQEMVKIANEAPGLPIGRIYALAKAENPDKAKAVAKKYADAREAAEKAAKAKDAPPPPKSPPPKTSITLSPGGSSGATPNQRMSPKQAAEAAWDDAVAVFGDPFRA